MSRNNNSEKNTDNKKETIILFAGCKSFPPFYTDIALIVPGGNERGKDSIIKTIQHATLIISTFRR